MASHRNPNAKPNQKPKTGNERRGNRNASNQARQNLKDVTAPIIKPIQKNIVVNPRGGRSSSTSSSNVNKPKIITPRGNELIRINNNHHVGVNTPNKLRDTLLNVNVKSNIGKAYNKLFNGFENAKPYQFQFDPYKQEIKDKETWQNLNDKEFNATTDRQGYLKSLQNYSSSDAVVQYATNNLQHTDYWFTATDFFGDAVLGQYTRASHPGNHFPNYLGEWLGEGVECHTQEEYNMYLKRFEIYQNYMKENTHSAKYYNPEHEDPDGFRDPFSTTTVMNKDAPLPPWVDDTPENRERWATYLARSDSELEMINAQGAHYHETLKEQGLMNVEAKEKGLNGKIGDSSSEFMDSYENGTNGYVNSFADVFAKSLQRQREGKTFLDTHSLEDSSFGDLKNYIRDYWVNPIRTGHLGKFFSNRLFGLMDMVDMPTKGARALWASLSPHVLYDGKKMFNDQSTFVYSGGKDKQKAIMEAGGAELLNSSFKLTQGYNPNETDYKAIKEKMMKMHFKDGTSYWDAYKTLAEEWRNYTPENSPWDNIVEAYTTPGKDFYTHTGNIGKDIAIDVLLDPTLIIGGGARSLATGAAKNIARSSVEHGLSAAMGIPRAYRALGRDEQRAVEGFIRKMDSKTVIFKNHEAIDREVDMLANRLMSSHALSNMNVDQFRSLVKSSIHDYASNTNAAIVATSKSGKDKAQEVFLKSVHNIGYIADRIDTSLLKIALPEPFLMKDTILAGKWAANNTIVGDYFSTIYNRRRQKRYDAIKQAFGDEYKGIVNLDLDQLEHFKQAKAGLVNMDTDTQMRCLGAAGAKFKSMQGTCESILSRLNRGNITSEEALARIKNELQYFAGREKCLSLDDLDTIVKNRFDGFFIGDSARAYEKFRNSYKKVEDFINIRQSNYEKLFIDELRKIDNVDDLFKLFEKYNLHLDYTNESVLKNIYLKYNKTAIKESELLDILTRIRELPRSFTTKSEEINPQRIVSSIEKSARTNPFDSLDKLSGSYAHKISEVKAAFERVDSIHLKAALDDPEIRGFQRLRSLLENDAGYKIHNDELLKTIDLTFYDVAFAHGFNVPDELKTALDELRVNREAFYNRKINGISEYSSGALYRYQLDRMVIFDHLINDPRILKLFDLYDESLRPVLEGIENGTLASIDSVNHSGLYKILRDLQRGIDTTNLFHRMNSELDLHINSYQKYAILDYLFGLSNKDNEFLLQQLTRDQSALLTGIDNAIYSSYGKNKIGINNARLRISDINNDIWGKYGEELRSSPQLQQYVKDLVEASPADPMSYINLQILQSILIDPDAIKYYNAVNKTNPVVFTHCATSGLSPMNSTITGIGFKQWTELSEEATLSDIFENIINKNNESLRVAMDESYFDNISEEFLNHIFDSHVALEHASYDEKLKAYKELFGPASDGTLKSEADVIQEFSKKIYATTVVKDGRKTKYKGTPCLVVHDFEGFNMPFIKTKIQQYADMPSVTRFYEDMDNFERLSENSFDQLKKIVNEQTLTQAEKDEVVRVLYEAIEDMNELGKSFRFLDLQNISSQMQLLYEYVSKGNLKGTNDPILKQVESVFSDSSNIVSMLADSRKACFEMKDFSEQASDYLLYRSSILDEASVTTNPIRYSRGEEPLQYLLNMRVKHDLTNIMSFFKADSKEPGILFSKYSLKTIEKMSDLSDYVVNSKKLLTANAEEFLLPYKEQLDSLILVMQDYVRTGNLNGVSSQSLEYLNDLVLPRSAAESYLICQKIYDDILKVYDQKLLRHFSEDTFNNGAFANILSMRFVDGYVDPFSRADFAALFNANDELLRNMFKGVYDAEIWRKTQKTIDDIHAGAANRSSIDKLNEAVDKARVMKEVHSHVRRKFRDVLNLDDLYISKKVITKKDHKEAMLYQHVADFLDSIGPKINDPEFFRSLEKIKSWRKDYSQYYYLRRLMKDGAFDSRRIINELLWNDTGMIVVYPNKFTAEVENDFKACIKQMNESFIDTEYEGGAFIVYIKKDYKIKENTAEKYRYLTGHTYLRSTRNDYAAIPFPEYKEIASTGMTEEIYEKLKLIYNDIDYFSEGASKGTLGNRLSMNELENFFSKIPNVMKKASLPNALLQQDMYKQLVCDPGFISSGSDIFSDILYTFEHLKRTTGDVKLTAEFIFGEHADTKVVDILSEVSNREALEYFSKVDDYAIVELKAGNTQSGMFMHEIKPKNEADIQRLRETDAVIIPQELFFELQSRMNYKESDAVMAVLNKALVLYKAIQLCSPGTWVRNYVDALTKAVLEENEGGIIGASQLISRSYKATHESIMVQRMISKEGSYISEGTWESLCRRYHIQGMTWDDYQMLVGLLDRSNVVNSAMHSVERKQAVVSGKTVNFSDLKDADIEKIWKRERLDNDLSVGMDPEVFNAIRRGDLVPNDILKKQYDEIYRKILTGIADYTEPKFDKVVSKIFIPFSTSEVAARYAQMLWLRDLGYSHNQAIKRTVNAQFRTLPNAHWLKKMEMVVPFATFKYNNAIFWIRMIDKNPSYYRLLEHIYGNIAQNNYEDMLNEYGEASVDSDYMLKTGGIPIGGSGLYFKLNPSCFDFFRLFYGGPGQNVNGLNPWLQFAMKYSMYELGFNSSEYLSELNYEYNMESFIGDTMHLIPGLNKMYDTYQHFTGKSFLYENAPNISSKLMVMLFPSLFGAKLDFKSRSGSNFEQYQANLAKDGLWFDCNEGKVVPLSEKNEIGANDPRLNWDDIEYYMLHNFGKVWDANVGHFVPLNERTEGGLNQEFDLEKDWDKLEAEYKKRGQSFDYNLGKFVPTEKLSSGGLNDPDISFDERSRLYYEKFGLLWDANQNRYVDRYHYIAGGLNDINGIHTWHDWNSLKSYRSALYGEEYKYNPETGKKEFVKTHEPSCVTLESLVQDTAKTNNFYQYVALPRLAGAKLNNCKVEDGFIKTGDGKYVLTWNAEYNNKVLSQFYQGYSGFRWKHYNWKTYQKYNRRHPRKFYDSNKYQGRFAGESHQEDFYRYQYPTMAYQFHRSDGAHRVHRTLSGNVIYGGGFNKFSYYQH